MSNQFIATMRNLVRKEKPSPLWWGISPREIEARRSDFIRSAADDPEFPELATRFLCVIPAQEHISALQDIAIIACHAARDGISGISLHGLWIECLQRCLVERPDEAMARDVLVTAFGVYKVCKYRAPIFADTVLGSIAVNANMLVRLNRVAFVSQLHKFEREINNAPVRPQRRKTLLALFSGPYKRLQPY